MLFDELRISGLRLPNRIVRAATYEKRADEDGHVTDELCALYESLARGRAGLIITGSALVHPSGRYLRRMLSAHSDIYIKGLKQLTKSVQGQGGLIALQLDHGGRQCPPLMLGGAEALAPSAIPDTATGSSTRAMEDHEIWGMAEAFGSAAFRARAAGFDAVEIQAAHGYLISSFLSPATNLREDYWGGDQLRRSHFLEETLKAVRSAVGQDFPLLLKLNANDHMPGGLVPEDCLDIAGMAVEGGANAIEVSGGMAGSPDELLPWTSAGFDKTGKSEGYYAATSAMLKSALNVPVILTGGFRKRAAMEDALRRGMADLIGISRAMIAEPDLPASMHEGLEEARCDHCNECRRFSRMRQVHCPRHF